jgi:hypothetical protein
MTLRGRPADKRGQLANSIRSSAKTFVNSPFDKAAHEFLLLPQLHRRIHTFRSSPAFHTVRLVNPTVSLLLWQAPIGAGVCAAGSSEITGQEQEMFFSVFPTDI